MSVRLTDAFDPDSLGLHPGTVEYLYIEKLTEQGFIEALTSAERVITTIGNPFTAAYIARILGRPIPRNQVSTKFRYSDVLYVVSIGKTFYKITYYDPDGTLSSSPLRPLHGA